VEAVWVALIVAAAAMVGPLLLARQQNRRQDVIAAQAAQAAELLKADNERVAAQAAEAAKLLLAANERVAEQSAAADRATQAKLQQIHLLVNSNLTEAQERELAAMKAMLVSMREVVALSRKLGVQPATDSLSQIESTEQRIAVLARNLEHKMEQTVKADQQVNSQEIS
jgi:hypothetical protein